MSAKGFEDDFVYQFFDTSIYSSCPLDPDSTEFEPCSQFLSDTSYKFLNPSTRISRKSRRVNMVRTNKTYAFNVDSPVSVDQALRHDHADYFMSALDDEMERLLKMGSYDAFFGDINSIDRGKLLSSKCIFSIKYKPDGTFDKYKCRIVARGDMLRTSPDTDLYAGTVRSDSMRLLYSIIAYEDLDLMSIDVKTAFLYPPLPESEVIFMRRPKGIRDDQMPAIMRLRKCIYGLPQASRYFNDHLSATLLSDGFKRLISDPQIYIKHIDDTKIICSTHVDDLLCAATKNSSLLQDMSTHLSTVYDITVTVDPTNHLGLVLSRDRSNLSLTLTQPAYVNEILEKFHISVPDKPPKYPMHTDYLSTQSSDSSPLLTEDLQKVFQQKVGCLMYLMTQTRIDLHFSVTQLSRRASAATTKDMMACDRLLTYVASTKNFGLTFCTYGEPLDLHVMCDVSYNCYPDSSKSHTGVSLNLGRSSCAFMTISKKQTIIADSSTVAEFIGTHAAVKAILWVRNLLTELGYPQVKETTILYQDNESTINMISHKGNAGRSKHIQLRYNIIRECVAQAIIKVIYCPTTLMTADTLTKPLSQPLFSIHQTRLLNLSRPTVSVQI